MSVRWQHSVPVEWTGRAKALWAPCVQSDGRECPQAEGPNPWRHRFWCEEAGGHWSEEPGHTHGEPMTTASGQVADRTDKCPNCGSSLSILRGTYMELSNCIANVNEKVVALEAKSASWMKVYVGSELTERLDALEKRVSGLGHSVTTNAASLTDCMVKLAALERPAQAQRDRATLERVEKLLEGYETWSVTASNENYAVFARDLKRALDPGAKGEGR